jgi:predicted aldo/keto reductase-like oxidoreductase
MADRSDANRSISRRSFLVTGGAAAAAGALARGVDGEETAAKPRVTHYRTLGRTGFEVSDVSLGGSAREANVIRYAYDRGINYFDSAESYSNGDNERALGDALQHMDRAKVFITTKLHIKPDESLESVLDRFSQCQERLRTEYVDALFIHGAERVEDLQNKVFHDAVRRLKADGRLRHAGVSCHGPRGGEGDRMDDVLVAAAEDGRFDLMLVAYGFINQERGDRVLAACKDNNVGTTAMKVSPGKLEVPAFDPENPSGDWDRLIKRSVGGGMSREQALEMVGEYAAEMREAAERSRPLLEKNGITDPRDLRVFAVKWVLSNPDMHSVCLRLTDYDGIDQFVPLSGTRLSRNERAALDEYRMARAKQTCHVGCNECAASCPHDMPVSSIMRYGYYFIEHGLEKDAMTRYARLDGRDGSKCAGCAAPCTGVCPHGVNIRANVLRTHDLLTLV